MRGRGALLGPEKSGLLPLGGGVGLVVSGSRSHWIREGLVWWVAGAALTKPLVWVSCSGCVVSLGLGVHSIGGDGRAGVPARILRTV